MVPHKVPVSVHGMINSENVHEDIFKTQMKLYKGKSYSDLCCSDKRVTIAAALIIIILDKRKREKQRKRKKILKKKKHPAKVFQKSKAVNDIPTVCPSVFMHQNPVTAEPPNLQKELSLQDAEMYRQYLKIDTNSFYKLFDLIKPLVQRKNTVMRECISTTERLAITLRYLALGETQKALAKEFRIAQNTISGIIPEVCQALCAVFEKALTLPSSAEGWRSVA
ncbi:UNVERIFIED_CONTAM: hypothetical protein GTU68_042216, partial [Idotea baltica]|nr:hypothetical protein [Idotea baltica]